MASVVTGRALKTALTSESVKMLILSRPGLAFGLNASSQKQRGV